MIITIDLDQTDLAELAFLDDLVSRLDEVRSTAALGSHLHDPPVLARGGDHGLSLGHVDADRLLNVDIGAGLHRGDHGQGVPVVGRGDEHDVEIFLGQHLAVIAVGPGLLLGSLAGGRQLGGLGEHLRIDVAERDHFHRGNLDQAKEVGLAVPARADQADALRLLGNEFRGMT